MLPSPQLESSFYKTIKVIQSCTTKEQLEGASRMIKNFKTLYRKVGSVSLLHYKLHKELKKQHKICQ